MPTISELKEQTIAETPLVVFDCALANGAQEHWSTHSVTVGDVTYAARVMQHSAFEIQTASDQGVDGSPRISVVLANADSRFSEIERTIGWKGARLTVGFLFYDLRNRAPLTDTVVVFQGTCNPPDEIKETTLRLTATNRMNLQRLLLPNVRIQRRCPWDFPGNPSQRAEAVSGGPDGKYSMFYRCGYSADIPGGTGRLDGPGPFTSCGHTREECEARGMGRRFGGLEFVPPAIAVRSYGKDWATSALSLNQARYNDFVPMLYGTAWYEPLVVFARNDGNLTRMEVLLGAGEMNRILTVLVNDIEIPLGVTGANMTATGWYNVQTLGGRDGVFDKNFTDAAGKPAGDPYGSMAYLSVVVPNRVSNGNSLPAVKVLAEGLRVPTYDSAGNYIEERFSSNPAWILLDILRRSGWASSEIDVCSFAAVASYCDECIESTDLNGNAISIPRFQCNLVLQKRRSAGDVIRGVRNAARLYLTYGPGGVLRLESENTIALQQPEKPQTSNAGEALDGGWPAYEFGDGSNGFSGILRSGDLQPTLSVRSRNIADTPNCLTVEFQDGLNGYQQDSYSLVDSDDVARSAQQVTSGLMALGIPNYDQAARILKFTLDRAIRGNTYVEFETSVKAFGIRPGDLITVTYLKQGFNRQPFRVLKIAPATNYRTVRICAQVHHDAWYADSNGQTTAVPGAGSQRNPGVATPRPLIGTLVDGEGDVQFGVESSPEAGVSVSFMVPAADTSMGPGVPLVSFTPLIAGEGTFRAGQVLYYAVSGVDAGGVEGGLSFVVQAVIPADGSSVTLSSLSFGQATSSFHVYRGITPAQLHRIASAQPIADHFTDAGLPPQLAGPPDLNFDHANFYWRSELQPECGATMFSAATIGNGSLEMAVNANRGMVARITRGRGAGQERIIAANDATSLTVTSPWAVEPDATSFFAIAEAGWHFGALTKSSPVQFAIPDRGGEFVHITGRAANVNDVECAPELSIVTRWQIGIGAEDTDVPPEPFFGLTAAPSGGGIILSGVSFPDLTNTTSITSGTLTLHYRDELASVPATVLATDIGSEDQTIRLSVPGIASAGAILQIEGELLQVTSVADGGMEYAVIRAAHGSPAASHAAQSAVFHLLSKSVVVSFPQGFFGSPYCGTWSYPITLPDVRIASAEMFVTNARGQSAVRAAAYTQTAALGLRSLSGGQYCFQVDGCLAVDRAAGPAVIVEAARSVKDVYAVLGTPADAPVQLQLNVDDAPYCALTLAAGMTVSNGADGSTLPPLAPSSKITLSVLSVGATYPGADLTVVIRL